MWNTGRAQMAGTTKARIRYPKHYWETSKHQLLKMLLQSSRLPSSQLQCSTHKHWPTNSLQIWKQFNEETKLYNRNTQQVL